jgi:hypothetical protein
MSHVRAVHVTWNGCHVGSINPLPSLTRSGSADLWLAGRGGKRLGGGPFTDYREPKSNAYVLSDSLIGNPAGESSFIAFVKCRNTYSIYLNNATTLGKTVHVSRVTDRHPNLPTSTQWTVNGRGDFSFAGALDGIRVSRKALRPSQFLVSGP